MYWRVKESLYALTDNDAARAATDPGDSTRLDSTGCHAGSQELVRKDQTEMLDGECARTAFNGFIHCDEKGRPRAGWYCALEAFTQCVRAVVRKCVVV